MSSSTPRRTTAGTGREPTFSKTPAFRAISVRYHHDSNPEKEYPWQSSFKAKPKTRLAVGRPFVTQATAATTNEAPQGAACRAVFQTAELLENIVIHLPPKNIFGVLRVSKDFSKVLTSPKVQEKVFLRLEPKTGPPRLWSRPDKAHVVLAVAA